MSNFGQFLSPSSLAGRSRHDVTPPFSPGGSSVTRSPKSPLGISISHQEHYIQPKPPMYVTEYEDRYSPFGTGSGSPKLIVVPPFSPDAGGSSVSSSPNSALAHSISLHEHYIKPVPPIYVTEYEDRYRDPRSWISRARRPA